MRESRLYALGARADELPLECPSSSAVAAGLAQITTPGRRPARRRVFRATGHATIPGYAPICLDSGDPFTIECGLKKRLLRDLPQSDPALLKEFALFVDKWIVDNLPRVDAMPFEEWLSGTSYTEQRKAELRRVEAALRGGVPTRRQAARVSMFGKTEAYAALKHLRLINSRCDQAKVFIGPRAKAIENVLYKLRYFVKHTPVAERPAQIRSLLRSGDLVYLSDYTAFESSFVKELMEACELKLYRHCLRGDEHCELMCRIISGRNRLRTRSGVRAELEARRMSGDMVTSLGNGFSNLMFELFLCQMRGDPNPRILVEGDDGLCCTTAKITPEDFARLGLNCKLVRVNDPCECLPVDPADVPTGRLGAHIGAFCGICCAQDGSIIKDPRSFLSTFGWVSSFVNASQRVMDELARAKALSAIYEAPQCPIIGALARRVLRQTAGVSPRFVLDGYHAQPRDERGVPAFSPTPECRALFARHFGVSVDDQLAIEARFEAGVLDVADLMPPHPDVAWYASRYLERSP